MENINLPTVKENKLEEYLSVFTIAPLFPGYGHTVGNGLRRVLLSSLPGAAVTSVMIDGVSHEFSAIPGVKEDAVELILNLKMLRVQMHDTEEPVTLVFSGKGPGAVTAKNFQPNSKVSISNPDLHIATLGPKATLNLEVTIEYGRGYDPIEKREAKSPRIGVITVDSLYTPVQSVSIEVENTRVGKMTNYDQLKLSIGTDGTITPSESLKTAAAILVDQFNLLANYDHQTPAIEIETNTTSTDSSSSDSDLINAGLPTRIANILVQSGYPTVASLKDATPDELKNVAGLGPKALDEIARLRG